MATRSQACNISSSTVSLPHILFCHCTCGNNIRNKDPQQTVTAERIKHPNKYFTRKLLCNITACSCAWFSWLPWSHLMLFLIIFSQQSLICLSQLYLKEHEASRLHPEHRRWPENSTICHLRLLQHYQQYSAVSLGCCHNFPYSVWDHCLLIWDSQTTASHLNIS